MSKTDWAELAELINTCILHTSFWEHEIYLRIFPCPFYIKNKETERSSCKTSERIESDWKSVLDKLNVNLTVVLNLSLTTD